MSKRSKNSLLTLSSNRSTHQTAAIKDELLAMKYTLNGPDASIYPYDDYATGSNGDLDNGNNSLAIEEDDKFKFKAKNNIIRRTSFKSKHSPDDLYPSSSSSAVDVSLTYPDYKPWLDHTMLSPSESKIENEKITNNAYLNKGYFEPPLVSNEYYLARMMIQNTIFSSSLNCQRILQDLLDQLATTYKMRNEQVNRIKHGSSTFKLPPRVTLTALKKEAWFRDLANPKIPLLTLANRIPHGVRNKVLLESLCSKFVPIPRAIWFTKCVLQSELVAWRKKISLRQQQILQQQQQQQQPTSQKLPSIGALENQWLQEWTQQLVEYINKYSREMTFISSQDKKQLYIQKLNYLLSFTQSLYIECLLDKPSFLSLIIKFFVEGLPEHLSNLVLDDAEADEDETDDKEVELATTLSPEENTSLGVRRISMNQQQHERQQQLHDLQLSLNYGQRLVALTLVKTYWNDVLKYDYLCKELCEGLLLNYYIIWKTPTKRLKHHYHQNAHGNGHGPTLPGSGPYMVASSPAGPLTGGYVASPIYATSPMSTTPSAVGNTNNINYNPLTTHTYSTFSSDVKNKLLKNIGDTIYFLVKFNANVFIIPNHWPVVGNVLYSILQNAPTLCREERLEIDKQYRLIKYRNESLMLNLGSVGAISTPDTLGNNNSTTGTSAPATVTTTFKRRSYKDILQIIYQLDTLKFNENLSNFLCPFTGSVGGISWKQFLKVVLYWCTTYYRSWSSSSCEKILIVCNFLKKVVMPKFSSNSAEKVEFENEILEIIYDMAEQGKETIVSHRLYVLINELYQLKLLTISSYLRKLIASGIFYVDSSGAHEGNLKLIDSHLNILKNLPVLNNRQCDSILKKWTVEKGFHFQEKFDKGKEIILKCILLLVTENHIQYDDNDVISLEELPVGLNFLLANWTTTQIKTIISNSPKLVHITPVILTKLYEFYSSCGCLTVFFKAILRFILKNDGMVIIYYMDTLRLISRLIIKHSKLVMLIEEPVTNSQDDERYELFKLVLNWYKDLLTREPDYFNFREYWKFMNNLIMRQEANEENTPPGNNDNYHQPQEQHHRHQNDLVPLSPDYCEDVEDLLSIPRQSLTQEDIAELLATVDLSTTSLEDLKIETLLQMLYNCANKETRDRDYEISLVRLLVQFKETDRELFGNEAKLFLGATTFNLLFCQKCVMYDILDISYFLGELTQSDLTACKITVDQTLIWNLARDSYFTKNPIHTLNLIIRGKLNPVPYLEQITRKYPSLIVEYFIKQYSQVEVFTLYGQILGIELCNKSQLEIYKSIASISNEFNLQICQVLLRTIERPDIRLMVEIFLNHLNIKFCPHNSYFGELFEYLNWEHRSEILENIVTIFVTQTKISENTIILESDTKTNLLPVFKDFFKKFLVNKVSDGITTLQTLFELLIQFTSKLANVIENQHTDNCDMYNAVCVCLRILIIHKQSLVSVINQYDPKFVLIKNLIQMLNSKYFVRSSSEKLRILLYDLLLLMKAGISEIITDPNTISLTEIPTTPGAMTPAPIFHYLPPEENVHRPSLSGSSNEANASNSLIVQEVFSLPEPNNENPLAKYLQAENIENVFTLDEDELTKESDIYYVNESSLKIIDQDQNVSSNLHLKSYELLEDIGTGLNDGCINLLLFESYTTRQNPP